MKKITLAADGWLNTQPPHVRRQLMRNVFDLAGRTGWAIRINGEHWPV